MNAWPGQLPCLPANGTEPRRRAGQPNKTRVAVSRVHGIDCRCSSACFAARQTANNSYVQLTYWSSVTVAWITKCPQDIRNISPCSLMIMKFPFSRGNGRGHARAPRLNPLAAHGTTSALPWQAAGVLVAAGILTQMLRPQQSKASIQTPAEPVQVPSALCSDNMYTPQDLLPCTPRFKPARRNKKFVHVWIHDRSVLNVRHYDPHGNVRSAASRSTQSGSASCPCMSLQTFRYS